MNPPSVGTKFFTPGGVGVTLLVGVVCGLAACGGSESSGEASSAPPDGAEVAAPAAATSNALLGTGFIMVSGLSQLHLTEATYLEESDCLARVSALGDAEEYEGCMEVPPSAICIQVGDGSRESDRWWECFVQEEGCEEANAGHEVVREQGGYVREVVRGCGETEMASVFASM
jgi:hypothetical protein